MLSRSRTGGRERRGGEEREGGRERGERVSEGGGGRYGRETETERE